MNELGGILVSAVLVNNIVLVRFLGLCPFVGVSHRLEGALGMGLATTFVLTVSAVLNHLVYTWVLLPLDAGYLRIIAFMLVIAAAVQFTEIIVRRTNPLLYQVLGIYLPLIASNCAILGITLLNLEAEYGLVAATVSAFGAAAGFTLVLLLFTGIRDRVAAADVPRPFKGAAIALISAGLLSLGFMGFGGMASG